MKSIMNFPLAALGLLSYNLIISAVLTYVPLIVYVILAKNYKCIGFVSVYLSIAAFFWVTLQIHPDYLYWYNREIFGIGYTIFRPDHGALWIVLFIELAKSPQDIWSGVKVSAAILFFYSLFRAYIAMGQGYWTYIGPSGIESQRSYDLDFGYTMMFVAVVSLIALIKEKRRFCVVIVIACVLLDLRFGSRGSFLCIAAFLVAVVLLEVKSVRTRVWTSILILTVAVVFLFFGNDIILATADFCRTTLGIDSRTINSLLTGDALDDNGRSEIYSLLDSFLYVEFFGFGAYGDRPIIGPQFYWGYSHSLFYEFAINFGVLPAMAILFAISVATIRRIMNSENEYYTYLIVVALCMSMRLIISDTFWGNTFFWMLIALLLFRKDQAVCRGREI